MRLPTSNNADFTVRKTPFLQSIQPAEPTYPVRFLQIISVQQKHKKYNKQTINYRSQFHYVISCIILANDGQQMGSCKAAESDLLFSCLLASCQKKKSHCYCRQAIKAATIRVSLELEIRSVLFNLKGCSSCHSTKVAKRGSCICWGNASSRCIVWRYPG